MPAAARLYKLALKQRETAVFGPCMGSGGTPSTHPWHRGAATEFSAAHLRNFLKKKKKKKHLHKSPPSRWSAQVLKK